VSDELEFRDPQPEDKNTGKKLQPLTGFGQGLAGIQQTSRLRRPEPTSPQELRDIAGYVAGDQSVADHTARMDAADRVLDDGIRAAMTTNRLRNPELVANEARWTAEVKFKHELQQRLENEGHAGDSFDFEPEPDADEILDSVLHSSSIRPAAQEDEEAFEHVGEDDDEEDDPEPDPLAQFDLSDTSDQGMSFEEIQYEARRQALKEQQEQNEQQAEAQAVEATFSGSQEFHPPSDEAMDPDTWGQ
jgi:hypothetical protein